MRSEIQPVSERASFFTMFDGAVRLCLLEVSFLEDPETFDACLKRLSAFRKEKTMKYRPLTSRCLSLGAGLALDCLLNAYGLAERDMVYTLSEKEKPAFAGYPDLLFNLSHSGKAALACMGRRLPPGGIPSQAASSTGSGRRGASGENGSGEHHPDIKELGCDIEQISSRDHMNIARYHFHPAEYKRLLQISEPQKRADTFCRLWTLKESLLKATGEGLSLPMSGFYFDLEDSSPPQCHWPEAVNHYSFEEGVFPGYRLSCCIGTAPCP